MPTSITSILIDATHLGMLEPTGVEVYTDALLPILSEHLLKKGIHVFWTGHNPVAPASMPLGVQWLYSAYKPLWSQRVLPHLLKEVHPDLFFTPSGIPPLRTAIHTAMTVHDLAVYQIPEAFTLTQQVRLRSLTARAAKKASLLLTPSHYTEGLIKKFWPKETAKVVVVPHGYTSSEVIAEPVSGLTEDPIFLYVGRLEKKKNLLPVIQGFSKLASERPGQLILAGSPGLGFAQIKKQMANLPDLVRGRVITPGFVTAGQKRWLYEKAVVALVPSLVEGFGIPVLDAFSYGCLPLCSQSGSLPEVAADAALYVQGDIATDWYLQMQKALEDQSLVTSLQKKGKEYLANFTWDKAAENTANALLSL